jgi:ferric-dicitrate binding protein FerR (iron transport regulator)
MVKRILAAFLLCASPAFLRADEALDATVTQVQGDVRITPAGAAKEEPAEAGQTVAAGAKIATGADGEADLLFEDGSAMHVGANARLQLQTARKKDGWREVMVKLWSGRLFSQVAKKTEPAHYRVRTPVAVAAVRGTEFVTDASDQGSQLAVFEGSVETQALAGPEDDAPVGAAVAVQPDQEISLAAGQPAGMPHPLSEQMRGYRENVARLFAGRIDGYRRDMSRVRRLQQEHMNRRRRRLQRGMEDRRKENERLMRQRTRGQQRRGSGDPR